MDYLKTTPGRLLSLALALPLLAGAVSPWNLHGTGPFALSVTVGLALTFVALGLSIDDHRGAALTTALALPLAIFVHFGVVGVIAPRVHSVVYLLGLAGVVALMNAIWPFVPTISMRLHPTRSHAPHPRST